MIGEAARAHPIGRDRGPVRFPQGAGFLGRRLQGPEADLPRTGTGSCASRSSWATGATVVSISPQEGFLHQVSELDTLGVDRPETQMQARTEPRGTRTDADRRPSARRLRSRSRSPPAGRAPTWSMSPTRRTTPSPWSTTAKMEVVKTIKVGQRPRGITITDDGKFILVCASDDDTIEMIDTETYEIVGTLPSGPDPELFVLIARRQDALRRQRGRQPGDGDRSRDSALAAARFRSASSRRAWGISPDGKTMVNTSETTNMAHFIDTATHEIADNVLVDSRPRFAEFKPDGSEVWVSSEIGGTVCGDRHRDARGNAQDRLRDPGPARRGDPAGRHRHHRATARRPLWRSARRTASPSSTPRPTRSRNICWSASASGSWPSRPTRSS